MSRYDFEEPIFSFDPKSVSNVFLKNFERYIKESRNLRSYLSAKWFFEHHRMMPQLAYERMLALSTNLDRIKEDQPDFYQQRKAAFQKANKIVDAEIAYLKDNHGSKIDTSHRYFDNVEAFTKEPTIQEKTKVKGGAGHKMVSDKKMINEAYLDDIHKEAERYIQNNPNNYLTKSGNPKKSFYSTVHRRLDDHAQVDGKTIEKPSLSTVKNRLIDWLNEKS